MSKQKIPLSGGIVSYFLRACMSVLCVSFAAASCYVRPLELYAFVPYR